MKTPMELTKRVSTQMTHAYTPVLLPLLILALTVAAAAQKPINFDGALATYIKGINDAGLMVGYYYKEDGIEHSFTTYDGKTFKSVDYPNAIWTEAGGINQAGDVVGFYGIAADTLIRGFLLTANGTWVPLDIPGRFNFMPEGINSNHTIIGCMHNPGTMHGWTMQNGAAVSISSAWMMYDAINDSGTIVGWAFSAPNKFVGFILNGTGETQFSYPNSRDTEPWGINDYGDIVGRYGPNSAPHGFLLHKDKFSSIDMPGSTVTATVATGINNLGTIVGIFRDENGRHGFLWKNAVPLN